MNRKSDPERVRSALFHAIKKTAANLDACVKIPGKDFSRKRKLPLQTMLLMLIGMGGGSLSKELYDWFGYTPSTATASAFVQQRNKIRSKAIEMIFNEFVASAMPTMTFRGYRLFAVDGSDLRLPSDPTNDFSLIRNMDGQKQYKIYSMKNKHPERQPQKAISSGCSFQRYFSSSLPLVIHKRLVLTPAS